MNTPIKHVTNKSMWTEAHWLLFNDMEKAFRNYFTGDEFGSNFDEFKKHMLYILEVMEVQYGNKCSKNKEK